MKHDHDYDDDLELCPHCGKMLPGHTVSDVVGNDEHGNLVRMTICSICALRIRNEAAGIPLMTPFTGTIAHASFLDAVAHLGSRAPKWAQRVAEMPKAAPGGPTKAGGKFVSTLDASQPE